jgi:phosphoglycerate dehydrogenase-like enzyme
MPAVSILFLHGLRENIARHIASYTPQGFDTTILDGDTSVAEQVEAVAAADYLIVYAAPLPDEVLRAARRARLVQLLAAGYDRMNLALMRELGIPCANNGGANSRAVADQTVLLMLALYRRLLVAVKSTREGTWNRPIDGKNTFEMAGKLVGILGMGSIGAQVARRVQGFEASVQYHDLNRLTVEAERELQVTGVSLEELFRTSDILTCHTPLTAGTRHIVNAERLASMKPTAILINTSRGPVVSQAALTESLRRGEIAGAGLDVFEQEPLTSDNPLLKMDNVVATPHSAGTTWDAWSRRAEFA